MHVYICIHTQRNEQQIVMIELLLLRNLWSSKSTHVSSKMFTTYPWNRSTNIIGKRSPLKGEIPNKYPLCKVYIWDCLFFGAPFWRGPPTTIFPDENRWVKEVDPLVGWGPFPKDIDKIQVKMYSNGIQATFLSRCWDFVCNRNSKWYLFKILGNYSCIQISMKTYTSTGPLFTSPGDFSDLTWCQTTRRAPSGIILLGAVSKHKVGKQLGHLGSAEWSANERSGWPFSPMTSKGLQ